MAVFRIEKTKEYTVMSNHHLHNKKLSFKAKGLLSFMLSLPENWNYTERGLAYFAKDGRDSIRAALGELEEEGYLIRQKKRNSNGTLGEMEYIIFEQPQKKSTEAEETQIDGFSPGSGKPTLVKPTLENPRLENPTIQSTNIENTKEQNTYKQINLSVGDVKESIKKQISYEDLLTAHQKEIVDSLLDIITELKVCAEHGQSIRVGQMDYPPELVLMKLSRIDFFHIEYVIDCMEHHKDKIRNIKAYLQKSILNAPDTMAAYYKAEMQHDINHYTRTCYSK